MMRALLAVARVLWALAEREADLRARRVAAIGALWLAALFVGLVGLLLLLYAVMLVLVPYVTPAGAAAAVGAAMTLLAAILIAMTFPSPRPRRRSVTAAAANELGDMAADATQKLSAGLSAQGTVNVALAALIAGLIAGRRL
jgi:hypothetical protein